MCVWVNLAYLCVLAHTVYVTYMYILSLVSRRLTILNSIMIGYKPKSHMIHIVFHLKTCPVHNIHFKSHNFCRIQKKTSKKIRLLEMQPATFQRQTLWVGFDPCPFDTNSSWLGSRRGDVTGCHGNPQPSFLGVIMHICWGVKPSFFMVFWVQGWLVIHLDAFACLHCARGSCVRISSGRGQPRWAEVSRGQPRWAEVSRGGPRWAEVGRGQPSWAEVGRGQPRWAEVSRGGPRSADND